MGTGTPMNNVLSRHCGGAKYLVKIDDDVLLDLPSLRDTLTRKHPGPTVPDTIQVKPTYNRL